MIPAVCINRYSLTMSSIPPRRRSFKAQVVRTLGWFAGFVGLLIAVVCLWLWYRYHGPTLAPVEIYQGLTYGCETLPETEETGGLVHWIKADLNVPGVELYTTPLDPTAVAQGFEYHLHYVPAQVKNQQLAAAVNGDLFDSKSWYFRMPGDPARSIETVVSNGQVNHIHAHTYLLWWDKDLNARLEVNKPPRQAILDHAKWGIGGQMALLMDGQVNLAAGRAADQRTMVAAEPKKRLVWVACFDKASYFSAAHWMADRGAKLGVMVDGGTSVGMAVGPDAKNVRTGSVTGNWRAVATVFGFKAIKLP